MKCHSDLAISRLLRTAYGGCDLDTAISQWQIGKQGLHSSQDSIAGRHPEGVLFFLRFERSTVNLGWHRNVIHAVRQ